MGRGWDEDEDGYCTMSSTAPSCLCTDIEEAFSEYIECLRDGTVLTIGDQWTNSLVNLWATVPFFFPFLFFRRFSFASFRSSPVTFTHTWLCGTD